MRTRPLFALLLGAPLAVSSITAAACIPSFDCFTPGDHCAQGGDGGPRGDAVGEGSPGATAWRREILVETDADWIPAGYSLRVAGLDTLAAAGHAAADFSNVHVFASDGTELDRVVDLTSSSSLWFAARSRIDARTTDRTSYALVYGRLDAGTPPADAAAVFASYDDFTGKALPGNWDADGSVQIGDGAAVLSTDDAGSVIQNRVADPPPYFVGTGVGLGIDVLAQVSAGPIGTFWIGFQGTTTPFSTDCPWQIWRGEPDLRASYCSGTTLPDAGNPIEGGLSAAVPHSFRIDRSFAHTRYYLDDHQWFDVPWRDPTPLLVIAKSELQKGSISVFWVRTRYVVDDEPRVSLGPERTYPPL